MYYMYVELIFFCFVHLLATGHVLGGGFKCFFMFIPIAGEVIQFDEHFFQRGLFNHHCLCMPIFIP